MILGITYVMTKNLQKQLKHGQLCLDSVIAYHDHGNNKTKKQDHVAKEDKIYILDIFMP